MVGRALRAAVVLGYRDLGHFSVAPVRTPLKRQGTDWGRQSRSVIFPTRHDPGSVDRDYIAQLNGSRSSEAAIVTTIEPAGPFYAAEDYHQDFLTRNPTHRYIVVNDLPKIEELKRVFPGLYRAIPVLVGSMR